MIIVAGLFDENGRLTAIRSCEADFEEAAKIKEEIDLFSAIVRKQKYLQNLNRDIVFWINMKNYKYKVYYISFCKIKYEKVIDASYTTPYTVNFEK